MTVADIFQASASQANHVWTLTECGTGQHQNRTLTVPSPITVVGRHESADLRIAASSVSKRHAELRSQGEQLFVRDLGSTNGTHVNGDAVTESELKEGDLVQFANALFRVGSRSAPIADGTCEEGVIPWAQTLITFDRLLSERAVIPFAQPIVQMDRQAEPGFEILARSNLPELQSPAAMFDVASKLGQDAALSELMRDEGARKVVQSGRCDQQIFLNTHPSEFGTERLEDSLVRLRDDFPELHFTIEVHESAVTELEQMRGFRRLLDSLEMKLSYDDFGAGQGRLLELTEVPPDVLKFDMQLIRDIDQATPSRLDLLRSLINVSANAGATPLAEGVETEAEHQACVDLGFQLGQGYLYGKPAALVPEQEANE